MSETPQSHPEQNEEEPRGDRLVALLERISPADEYDPESAGHVTKDRLHVVYPSDNPRETVTVLSAADRWNVMHKNGRKSSLYWVYRDSGNVFPLEQSDLRSTSQIDMRRTPDEVQSDLLSLIESSSSEKPEGKRKLGKGALKQLLRR